MAKKWTPIKFEKSVTEAEMPLIVAAFLNKHLIGPGEVIFNLAIKGKEGTRVEISLVFIAYVDVSKVPTTLTKH